jgi:hypothetical protein
MSDTPKEKIFVDGINLKMPSDKAPEYILLQAGFNVKKFSEWATQYQDEKGWVNITIKRSKNGNIYAELDTWKPNRPTLAEVGETKEKMEGPSLEDFPNINEPVGDIPF